MPIQSIFKMLGMSNTTNLPSTEEEDPCGEPDEPPDSLQSKRSVQPSGNLYTKSTTTGLDTKKESLLTRALLDRPEHQSSDTSSIYIRQKSSVGLPTSSTHSSASTAELTSDGGVTSPERANTPSPPLPSQFTSQRHPTAMDGAVPPKVPYLSINAPESTVEANLGRKRCIKFACGGKDDSSNDKKKEESKPIEKQEAKTEEPPKRKSMLTFACPTRTSDVEASKPAHAPVRKSSPNPQGSRATNVQASTADTESTPRAVKEPKKEVKKETFPGLGDFEHSEATRFHEFASLGEDDAWVNQEPVYKGKMTFQDCMKKEDAIRRLGEEAEEEARQDEEDEEDAEDDDDDYDDDDDDNDGDEDESTVHDLSSDDGNESDNEAGFADSDSEEDSEYDFWPSSTVTAATSAEHVDIAHPGLDRKVSDSSVDSLSLREDQRNMSTASLVKEKRRQRAEKPQKSRPGTPDLPDSTDFVCGTLDEDRPMEAAFISCMEERRRSKHVVVPQDIDPSFPTTDPEDNDDDDDDDEDDSKEDAKQKQMVDQQFGAFNDVSFRGRGAAKSRKTSPQHSPKRLQSPPPRRAHHHSPKRLRSPPPLAKKTSQGSRRPSLSTVGPIRPGGINITGLGQKPNRPRTKSLPRTPNPFFIRLEKSWHTSNDDNATDNGASRCGEGHARGAIDIVKGLEQRRQKRKEKFWRQHCRKTGKDGQEKKPLPGKGAERMKELGLVAAERCRAYGLDQAQLVLSV